ncbi:hypothetical protein KBB96_17100 [Luteolibacter ambystomatis]|uniref:Uncharacterized protein n=1 Tax=Luteolibacter ambystomatis TaxID=2824561 RepID=A0A975G7W0_9BACT|nr:hypothetical protein [Luteolibacter ambystomatis]QUE50568.1 hypothetical protein KBB96_17100 [Luteolibacter ambystomatis]
MSEIPCQQNPEFRTKVVDFAETLKTRSHELVGLSEDDVFNSGLFRAAIERIRGQFSATMRDKRDFISRILNHLQDSQLIEEWESAESRNRHDYTVKLPSGKLCVIEAKGCLDGNNTNIFERPAHANEFIIWSICQNPGADPRKNVWSGLHTRLSAEIISKNKQVDGLVVWDMVCGTIGRPCPKMMAPRVPTNIGPFHLPPPCIYLFPDTIPSVRNNPNPTAQALDRVEMLKVLHTAFLGVSEEVNYVDFEVRHQGAETVRRTTIRRAGAIQKQSDFTPIQRS